jgi:superfamily I DNA/RNA helicase
MASVHQAKGLIFWNVLVYDFRFGTISPAVVTHSQAEDKASILFVAIMRAKMNLYLSSAVIDYLMELSEFFNNVESIQMIQSVLLADIREKWEQKWQEVEAGHSQ